MYIEKVFMKILTTIIVIVGIGFVVLAVVKLVNNSKYDKLYYEVSEPFKISNFYNNNKFENTNFDTIHYEKKYHIIYLFSSDDCSPCTKEILDYYDIVKRQYNKFSIQQIGIIVDSSVLRLRMYLKRNTFNMPIFYGYDIDNTEPLQKYNNRDVKRQVVVVDSYKNEIIFRIYLRKGYVTDEAEKINILNNIFNK